MESQTINLSKPNKPALHPYDVEVSPHNDSRLLVAAAENYGIAGKGAIMELARQDGASSYSVIRKSNWSDGIFSCCWVESDPDVYLTCSGDGSVMLWRLGQPEPVKLWQEHVAEVHRSAFITLHYRVESTRSRKAIDHTDLSMLHERLSCTFRGLNLFRIRFNQHRDPNLFATVGWDSFVKLWSLTSDQSVATLTGHRGNIYDVTWCVHGSPQLATAAADGKIIVWDAQTQRTCATHQEHGHEVLTCDWHKYFADVVFSGSVDRRVLGYDLRLQRPVYELLGHTMAVRTVVCDPHSEHKVYSGGYDFSTIGWDLRYASQPVEQIAWRQQTHREFVTNLTCSLTTPELIDCSWDSTLQIYTTE
eukprot:TRINITY_DN8960_c0_g1_i1.p1 TRINITY_DN8960_c0_g1~~TRINITY_DN8960_c0_g1_i1.p1  ORF type:complete len:362 (+),score=27.76 TRINITY_DN8960_c0_g1_i1:454-1539(+)